MLFIPCNLLIFDALSHLECHIIKFMLQKNTNRNHLLSILMYYRPGQLKDNADFVDDFIHDQLHGSGRCRSLDVYEIKSDLM